MRCDKIPYGVGEFIVVLFCFRIFCTLFVFSTYSLYVFCIPFLYFLYTLFVFLYTLHKKCIPLQQLLYFLFPILIDHNAGARVVEEQVAFGLSIASVSAGAHM